MPDIIEYVTKGCACSRFIFYFESESTLRPEDHSDSLSSHPLVDIPTDYQESDEDDPSCDESSSETVCDESSSETVCDESSFETVCDDSVVFGAEVSRDVHVSSTFTNIVCLLTEWGC